MSGSNGRKFKFRVEKFSGQNFGLWKTRVEDYLYKKDDLYLALKGQQKGQPDDMYNEDWKLLDHRDLGII